MTTLLSSCALKLISAPALDNLHLAHQRKAVPNPHAGKGIHPRRRWYHVLTEPCLPIILLHLALIAIFGVLVPQRKGIEFLDPVMISAYACMGVIFAAPAAAAAFAKGRPQSMKEAFARAAKAAGYGEGLALVMLVAGVATVNLSRAGRLRLPELDTLGESALLGITATIAVVIFAGWMTLRFSAGAARTGVRAVLLLLLLAFFLRSQRLPEVALRGAALSVALSGLMAFLLYREVNPR